MIYYDHNQYLKALDVYRNTPAKIINGDGWFFVKGEWVTSKEYFEHNTEPIYQPAPKVNADSTHISSETIRKKST